MKRLKHKPLFDSRSRSSICGQCGRLGPSARDFELQYNPDEQYLQDEAHRLALQEAGWALRYDGEKLLLLCRKCKQDWPEQRRISPRCHDGWDS